MKRHYLSLDGLRGVAALTVVGHHLQKAMGLEHGFLRAGYLSVDFFFALSGFVIAAAYEAKLTSGMKFPTFLGVRIQRLYPMIFFGAWVGLACAIILGDRENLALGTLSQLLLIPVIGGGAELFRLNAVYWSLLFEVAANVGHAITLRWLSLPVLIAGVALSAAAAVFTAITFGHFGGGWSLNNWWAGFVRVAFSYGVGVLIYRLHIANRLPTFTAPFPVLAVAFVAAIIAASQFRTWWADLAPVVFFFPLILIAGVNAKPGRSVGVVAMLGAVSYPLYAVHGPIVVAWQRFAPNTLLSATIAMVVLVAFAFALDRWYDGPVRAFVTRKTRPKPAPQDPAAAGAGA